MNSGPPCVQSSLAKFTQYRVQYYNNPQHVKRSKQYTEGNLLLKETTNLVSLAAC